MMRDKSQDGTQRLEQEADVLLIQAQAWDRSHVSLAIQTYYGISPGNPYKKKHSKVCQRLQRSYDAIMARHDRLASSLGRDIYGEE